MVLKGNLKRHMHTVHSRPYNCPEKGCGMTFTKFGLLRNHIRLLHGNQEENLEGCNDSWQELDTTNTKEVQHQLENEDSKLNSPGFARNGKEALYPCAIKGCDRMYVNKQSLIRHNRIDHYKQLPLSREKSFLCKMPQCGSRFAFRGNLLRHIREVHEGNKRSGEAGKKSEEEDTFVYAEEIDIDIDDVNDENVGHEGGIDDDGTMEVVLDTTKLFEEAGTNEVGAEVNSQKGNVAGQEKVDNSDNNVNNMEEENKDGEAAVESFKVNPLMVGHQLEDEIY